MTDDADVQIGLKNEALITWYFALNHELAHNLGVLCRVRVSVGLLIDRSGSPQCAT